jgi:hypothetical protein
MPGRALPDGRKKKVSAPVSAVSLVRRVPPWARLLLYVRAGGRCEFDGCNKYLLEHHLTLAGGNFGEAAHIVAFKPAGPRGSDGPRPKDVDAVDNLMLLCPECHKLIDDNPGDYSRATLQLYKERHEARICHVTGLGPDLKTSVLTLKANIGKQAVSIPFGQITEATAPRYPLSRAGAVIDLTAIHGDDDAFFDTATKTIARRVAQLYEPGSEATQAGHISVFALGPIPLLVFLGSQLSNKLPVCLFQRHRDTEKWVWKKGSEPVEYEFQQIRPGTNVQNVALLLSLSGTITENDLPRGIDGTFSLYAITPKGMTPDPTFLRSEQDLHNFRVAYQQALGIIVRNHGLIQVIHLFPAVPAPVAVLCGRELLPKAYPGLLVYDYDKSKGGFTLQLRINYDDQ